MINGIDYEKFASSFLQTDIGKQIEQDFDSITCTPNNDPSIIVLKNKCGSTCRELLGSNDIKVKNPNTTMSIVTFYYLNLLQEIKPNKIYDIGCGWNIWKSYMPNIHGVDTWSNYADEVGHYNSEWVEQRKGQLEAAFTINMDIGLSQEPATFDNIGDQILEFAQLLKPGGRGYISLAGWALLKFTSDDWYEQNHCSPYNPTLLQQKTKEIMESLPLKIIALDCEFDLLKNMPGHDGELRVVFEVPK